MMSRSGGDVRIDKKGTIDLVTDVDIAIEREFRALVAERFPDHDVLAEELGGRRDAPSGPCWVFDPIDGTTNFAHGLPIFCSSVALEVDGMAEVAAVYDPTRKELFTAERGGGAFLNGQPIRVSLARELVDAMLVTGFPSDVHERVGEIVGGSLIVQEAGGGVTDMAGGGFRSRARSVLASNGLLHGPMLKVIDDF